MRAVPVNEGVAGSQLCCFLCNRTFEELYSLTPEDNAEWDKLELSLGESSNWFICMGCLGIIEDLLGYEIIFSTDEEAMEIEASWTPPLDEEVLRTLRNNLEAINERKCPKCGHLIEESFSYMTDDRNWGIKRTFRSIILKCSYCDFSQTLSHPNTDAALGYFLRGIILDFDSRFIKIEVSPSNNEIERNPDVIEKSEKLILQHMVDLPVLKSYQGLMELVEILVIGNRVVRVIG